MTNLFPGLARGPIDHNASSVINAIANAPITMGQPVKLVASPDPTEILPRVEPVSVFTDIVYGVVVGGDTDGIYGNGAAGTGDTTFDAAFPGEGVVVVTRGRCLARVAGSDIQNDNALISIGDRLTIGIGRFVRATPTGFATTVVSARALQTVLNGANDMAAIDLQREGFGS